MKSVIHFKGDTFPPSFGYLEAWDVCVAVNNENSTWNVDLEFSSNSNFSFSSFNATAEELKETITTIIMPLLGPKQLPAFAFPVQPKINLDEFIMR